VTRALTTTSAAVRSGVRHGLARLGYTVIRDNGRAATIFDDDRLIVSYPRSGNTWLSFLLTTLAHPGEPTTFVNLEERCPDIYAHSDAFLRSRARPRLLKSHEAFDPRYRRVVYLVRDPRDVAVSYFRFLVKTRAIDESLRKEDFVHGWVRGDWGGEYGTWGEHVGSWRGAREDTADSFHMLRYEDLHADPVRSLAAVAAFLGIEHSDEACKRALELCRPERMRELERVQAGQALGLKGTRLGVPFVGAATVGSSTTELTNAQRTAIADAWAAQMRDLGYETAVEAGA
jgi:hypothetical protein